MALFCKCIMAAALLVLSQPAGASNVSCVERIPNAPRPPPLNVSDVVRALQEFTLRRATVKRCTCQVRLFSGEGCAGQSTVVDFSNDECRPLGSLESYVTLNDDCSGVVLCEEASGAQSRGVCSPGNTTRDRACYRRVGTTNGASFEIGQCSHHPMKDRPWTYLPYILGIVLSLLAWEIGKLLLNAFEDFVGTEAKRGAKWIWYQAKEVAHSITGRDSIKVAHVTIAIPPEATTTDVSNAIIAKYQIRPYQFAVDIQPSVAFVQLPVGLVSGQRNRRVLLIGPYRAQIALEEWKVTTLRVDLPDRVGTGDPWAGLPAAVATTFGLDYSKFTVDVRPAVASVRIWLLRLPATFQIATGASGLQVGAWNTIATVRFSTERKVLCIMEAILHPLGPTQIENLSDGDIRAAFAYVLADFMRRSDILASPIDRHEMKNTVSLAVNSTGLTGRQIEGIPAECHIGKARATVELIFVILKDPIPTALSDKQDPDETNEITEIRNNSGKREFVTPLLPGTPDIEMAEWERQRA